VLAIILWFNAQEAGEFGLIAGNSLSPCISRICDVQNFAHNEIREGFVGMEGRFNLGQGEETTTESMISSILSSGANLKLHKRDWKPT
jgi:hypothetical protein